MVQTIVSIIVGGAFATGTIVGVVQSQTSAPDKNPVVVGEVGIVYGTR